MSSGTGFQSVSHALCKILPGQYNVSARFLQSWLKALKRYLPEQGTIGHDRLNENHISVCDMVQNPSHQLAVLPDRVHADVCVVK